MLTYLLFFIGFALLIKGAGFLVDGASSIAKKFGISALAIGLTIVAFGTSAPELIVNILSSLRGSTDLAIGNIIGSNSANILLILGISAAIYPLAITKGTVWKEIPLSLLAVVVVAIMSNDALIENLPFSALGRVDGLVLLSFFVIFLYYTYGISKIGASKKIETKISEYSLTRSVLMAAVGLVGLTVGGKWVVDGAIFMAKGLGASEALIGLTVVAIGTSLPELATSAVAAYKKNADIAVGNIVGSNIFNIFWILGISAIVKPLPFNSKIFTDVIVTVIATILLFAFMFIGKKHVLERWQGAAFVLLYIIYVAYLIIRG